MFRAGQIKFTAFRLHNTVFQFCRGHLLTQRNGRRCVQSIHLEYFAFGTSVAVPVASTAVYGVMSHLYGGRCSPLQSTAALK